MAAQVDSHCPFSSTASVHGDFNATLNQTNINHNNNKFYIIQLIDQKGQFYVWCHWGRVGETGQSSLTGPLTLAGAQSEFEKKFRSKTSNAWGSRAKFVPKAGKYELIEVEGEADADTKRKLAELDASKPIKKAAPVKHAPSALDASLQSFLQLIFDKEMFVGAMSEFDIDTRKMPLGQLSKNQVQRGFDVLVDLQKALDGAQGRQSLANLSSHFYTVIPHAFGRRVPPIIDTTEKLQKKMDMLNVLSDIEVALSMDSTAQDDAPVADLLPNPIDKSYTSLKCHLTPVDKASDEFRLIDSYLKATRYSGSHDTIIDAFRADRHGEGARFDKHSTIDNRKLLWHGTNIAVIAAILSSGLRIMPHSGGRVGKGIYLAAEQSKSAGYTSRARGNGVMFLCEAALGREHSIVRDDSSLRAPPKGFDSIIAQGHTDPDPKLDTTVTIDGKTVILPQGAPIRRTQYAKSTFSQSEYLLYQESQVRIRYVLRMRM